MQRLRIRVEIVTSPPQRILLAFFSLLLHSPSTPLHPLYCPFYSFNTKLDVLNMSVSPHLYDIVLI
jgi:hypothetical protein